MQYDICCCTMKQIFFIKLGKIFSSLYQIYVESFVQIKFKKNSKYIIIFSNKFCPILWRVANVASIVVTCHIQKYHLTFTTTTHTYTLQRIIMDPKHHANGINRHFTCRFINEVRIKIKKKKRVKMGGGRSSYVRVWHHCGNDHK